MLVRAPIPVVDLFAGPGGLSEGFSSLTDHSGSPDFQIALSIEKDPTAHRTLALRALFRSFPCGRVPDCYYDYLKGGITAEQLWSHPGVAGNVELATCEARRATLGIDPSEDVDAWIRGAIGNSDPWVLIGGPPCQAYSLAGRSRMRSVNPEAFEGDTRHLLYQEYLRIVRAFGPAVFVMENVKGILTSKHGGGLIFGRILNDLSEPGGGLQYEIRSFVVPGRREIVDRRDFIIKAEDYGVPQMRHRVILLGIRRDISRFDHESLKPAATGEVSVDQAIDDLPPLRSRVSKETDSLEIWLDALKAAPSHLRDWRTTSSGPAIKQAMVNAYERAALHVSTGARFIPTGPTESAEMPDDLREWYLDERLGGVTLHDARSHMRSDLQRYLFASCYAAAHGVSPRLRQFPATLLPNHRNARRRDAPNTDRFRVQHGKHPATTIMSHIAKDGHYYIHPDPSQCRSLTVREAARLQTFPDNYFFEGGRTEQYAQVGNAVPPYLARQIATIVRRFIASAAEEDPTLQTQRALRPVLLHPATP